MVSAERQTHSGRRAQTQGTAHGRGKRRGCGAVVVDVVMLEVDVGGGGGGRNAVASGDLFRLQGQCLVALLVIRTTPLGHFRNSGCGFGGGSGRVLDVLAVQFAEEDLRRGPDTLSLRVLARVAGSLAIASDLAVPAPIAHLVDIEAFPVRGTLGCRQVLQALLLLLLLGGCGSSTSCGRGRRGG